MKKEFKVHLQEERLLQVCYPKNDPGRQGRYNSMSPTLFREELANLNLDV